MQRQLSTSFHGGSEEDRQLAILLPRHPLGYRIVHPGRGNICDEKLTPLTLCTVFDFTHSVLNI